jgi:hypothetical protein
VTCDVWCARHHTVPQTAEATPSARSTESFNLGLNVDKPPDFTRAWRAR